ncbi:phosphate ABC transporter ATP-binding protein [Pediococcus acidilactici]|jgi:phosphate transport system ATP-binding protein|uniref:Phosphate ABC transporter, ATP-binding protein n=1 Tax=Pediococcus acidilactici DSM 20284 TaxID=862514 RepID=E0NI54_PEDAC|nr:MULTISPECIES: phosphate ABC transporter ATP-binding protein PstB [Pediococcus]AZP90185.1 phosphate ABC transporter ATP-binding protein [Pediococcus acidilactici]EFL94817.1 phosphate ABC transporter, ATP-binding protein [Pediococcus acidilactici DSM 20284]KAF0363743.1 phosphate ABC transporter ATP-binding protein [Pediococcus acidilactici]KAF0367499.1 phosphate ABC transporter ATP-binding protein [Pediococcus acidilactici]KAF0370467.1 phosphate ABC transporter ATP-binding protein [Pediococcu
MSNNVVTAEDVRLSYGETEALHGINLNLPQNQITALIGPSGSGKSTFLRCLNRMNDLIPEVRVTGTIRVAGQDIYDAQTDEADLRRRVGMVFQQPNPFPFSVYDNVTYGLRLAGITDPQVLAERVETSLKQAAVWQETKDHLKSNALSFSGGQQQRICIARVLAVQPEIILLDEPTSALDPISAGKVEESLVALKENYTLAVVTHNMQQASRISDQTAFFLNGQLIEAGPTAKLFLNPDQTATSDYLNGKFG